MRKIEQQMIAAIKAKRNWASGNTSVHYSEDYKSSTVYLHGNLIAIVYENDAELFDSGYQTVTTKSRLNAICREFGVPGEGIFQKDFQYEFDSRTHGYGYKVTDESFIPQLFNSAMVCAC